MHRTSPLIIILCLVVTPTLSHAKTYPQVFQIIADDCISKPTRRFQTGFLLHGYDGMLTALHGVAGCDSITARNSETEDVFHNLTITEIDIENDVALLTSQKLSGAALQKFSEAFEIEENAQLTIVGHPLSLMTQHKLPLELESTKKVLEDLITTGGSIGKNLRYRGSPSIGAPILSLTGDIQPGHSGAPILDSKGDVVGIGNGGLKSGTTGLGWGIPIKGLDLKLKSKRLNSYNELIKRDPELLFDFAAEDLISFRVSPPTVCPGQKVTLYFDERVKDRFTVHLAGRILPKRTLSNGREVIITVPSNIGRGRYHVEIKRWEDDQSKSDNEIRVLDPVIDAYEIFSFKVEPKQIAAGEDVRLVMNNVIGNQFYIYIKKNGAAQPIRLNKKNVNNNRMEIVVNLPKSLSYGHWFFEMTSIDNVHRYRSNLIYVTNPRSGSRRAPTSTSAPASPGRLNINN